MQKKSISLECYVDWKLLSVKLTWYVIQEAMYLRKWKKGANMRNWTTETRNIKVAVTLVWRRRACPHRHWESEVLA
ncbi:hypothetical protein T06_9942 [Trichinella sp. T6]|nr:hypothetical protein T06_9942 [Trichinella sp. T6]